MHQYLFVCVIFSSLIINVFFAEEVKLIEYENENDGLGNSRFRYLTNDGTLRDESVKIKNENTENAHPVIHGFYEFLTSEGVKYSVFYDADENGFRSRTTLAGEEQHIPTAAIITLQGGLG